MITPDDLYDFAQSGKTLVNEKNHEGAIKWLEKLENFSATGREECQQFLERIKNFRRENIRYHSAEMEFLQDAYHELQKERTKE